MPVLESVHGAAPQGRGKGFGRLALSAEGVTNRFFVEAPQKIFAHLLSYLPTPKELIKWMSDPAEIDRRVKGTEYWMLIDPKAPQQRPAYSALSI